MSFELALFFVGKSTLLQFELSLFTEKTGIFPDSCVSLNWHATRPVLLQKATVNMARKTINLYLAFSEGYNFS